MRVRMNMYVPCGRVREVWVVMCHVGGSERCGW